MTELKAPDSVTTPGRTWTEFPEELEGAGEGSLEVEAPDSVEVRRPREGELFDLVDAEKNTVTAHHRERLDPGNAVVVRIPEGAALEEPIRIESEIRSGFFPHHVIVIAGEGCSATVVERNSGEGSIDSSIVEVRVGEDAHVRYRKLNDLGAVTGYVDSRAEVQEGGTIGWVVVSTGSDLYRNTVETELVGPRSRLDYRLGFLSSGDQHLDHTSHVTHAADNTRCDMDSRGVALDSSRVVYKGVQEVAENSEGTKSFQDEKTVLVGEEAEADTTPQLRIDNHDVEATHAATTGHVNQEDLFYMRSRGMSEEDAKREIIQGMFDDLLDGEETRGLLHLKIREVLAA